MAMMVCRITGYYSFLFLFGLKLHLNCIIQEYLYYYMDIVQGCAVVFVLRAIILIIIIIIMITIMIMIFYSLPLVHSKWIPYENKNDK